MIAPLMEPRAARVTGVVVATLVAFGALEQLAGGTPVDWLLWRDAPRASAVATSLLAHASPRHLAYNVFMLAALGTLLERRVGALNFLAVTVWTAIGSALGWLLIDSGDALGGASGVAFGVLGACVVLCRSETVPVGLVWPQALLVLVAQAGGNPSLASWGALLTPLAFLCPHRAGRLLVRARLHPYWLTLPLIAQAIAFRSPAVGAHWAGFVCGVAVGAALRAGAITAPSLRVEATLPLTPGSCSPPLCSRKDLS
ncbi:MAG: rhomboid family intramembrane serine protease [Planctomycetota bacterium]